jgi:hypothetical protein
VNPLELWPSNTPVDQVRAFLRRVTQILYFESDKVVHDQTERIKNASGDQGVPPPLEEYTPVSATATANDSLTTHTTHTAASVSAALPTAKSNVNTNSSSSSSSSLRVDGLSVDLSLPSAAVDLAMTSDDSIDCSDVITSSSVKNTRRVAPKRVAAVKANEIISARHAIRQQEKIADAKKRIVDARAQILQSRNQAIHRLLKLVRPSEFKLDQCT